jgi:hypothetical protein
MKEALTSIAEARSSKKLSKFLETGQRGQLLCMAFHALSWLICSGAFVVRADYEEFWDRPGVSADRPVGLTKCVRVHLSLAHVAHLHGCAALGTRAIWHRCCRYVFCKKAADYVGPDLPPPLVFLHDTPIAGDDPQFGSVSGARPEGRCCHGQESRGSIGDFARDRTFQAV